MSKGNQLTRNGLHNAKRKTHRKGLRTFMSQGHKTNTRGLVSALGMQMAAAMEKEKK